MTKRTANNFAVVLGLLQPWIGKTALPVDGRSVFGTLQEARARFDRWIQTDAAVSRYDDDTLLIAQGEVWDQCDETTEEVTNENFILERSVQGQTTVEYVLVIAVLAVVISLVVQVVQRQVLGSNMVLNNLGQPVCDCSKHGGTSVKEKKR